MDPLLESLAWGVGLLVLVAVAVLMVVQLRRRFTTVDEAEVPVANAARADWIGLLTALPTDRVAMRDWLTLAPGLVAQVASCPAPLRTPLIAALDGAIARCSDPLASASMTQLRRALAALPAA